MRKIGGKSWICIALFFAWYSFATLPYLADFPTIEAAEMGIAAPAYKLATQGVYGNDLYTGFYRNHEYNYEYLPLYPLLVALFYKLFGLGVDTARLLSVLCGAITLFLTFLLGRQLFSKSVGVAAVGVLCCLRLGFEPSSSGIPLAEIARVIRYDILVPIWVLSCCLCFHWAERSENVWGYFASGLLAGLATLTHVYGAFILAPLFLLSLARHQKQILRRPVVWLLLLGWLLALLPWCLYILPDFEAFRGQNYRHSGRADFFNPLFFWHNLRAEYFRYLPWIGPHIRQPVLWPRLGIYLFALGSFLAHIFLWQQSQGFRRSSERFLLITPGVLALMMAVLFNLKRYPYLALLLPFLALQVGYAFIQIWKWSQKRSSIRSLVLQWVLGLLLGLAVVESGLGILSSHRVAEQTTPYLELTDKIAEKIPPGSGIVALHHYWLGLAEYEVRALDLAFVLSNPRYGFQDPPSMTRVLASIGFEYLVLEDSLLQQGLTAVYLQANPEAAGYWRELYAYLQEHCTVVGEPIQDSDYGRIVVYRCLPGSPLADS